MQQQVFLLIIVLKFLLIKSQPFTYSYGKINFLCYYSPGKSLETRIIPVTSRQVLRIDVNNSCILRGNAVNDRTLIIRAINCTNCLCSFGRCGIYFESSYIFLQNIMLTDQYLLKVENQSPYFKRLIHSLSFRPSFTINNVNLTCVFVDVSNNNFEKPNDHYQYPLSKINLFGIIFLSVCLALVFFLIIGWIILIYYRRFKQYRMKKKLQKILAQSTQQILDKSPVIIFDPTDYSDDDPTCAVCLESFKTEEKIRKLVCSHYFHLTCIDPWLLSHQSCPLCNRNILRNSIPSISSSIMEAINQRNNDESTSIANNDNN